jgi:integrase
MSKQTNLTRARIDSFICPPASKESYLWDSLQSGFGIRAYASGKKSYVFRTTVNGKTQKGVIGDSTGDLTEARTEARRLKTLASKGISPAEDRRQRVAVQQATALHKMRGSITLVHVWREYLRSNQTSWGHHHYNDHLKAFREPNLPCGNGLTGRTKAGPLWVLRNIKLTELNPDILVEWMNKESITRGGVTGRASRLLFACLTWCNETKEYSGLVNVSNLKTRQFQRATPKLSPRTDVLEAGQLSFWFTEVRKINNPIIASFVQCLLITGARKGELLSLKWSEVDFNWNSLTIRDKATTRGNKIGTRVIPLTPYVSELIQQLPRTNQYVFSSPTSKSGQLVSINKSYEPALSAAELKGLTLHGLRRSFSTLSEWVETPSGIAAQLMGHKPSAISEKHYKQRPLDLLRVWHERIESWMLIKGEVDYQEVYSDTLLTGLLD